MLFSMNQSNILLLDVHYSDS